MKTATCFFCYAWDEENIRFSKLEFLRKKIKEKAGNRVEVILDKHTYEDNADFDVLREKIWQAYPGITGCIIHSDRGSQYTSQEYRELINCYGIIQSMNSDGGRCHDNARCESMWARMKEELFYSRGDSSENYTISELKTIIWRYFMSYWSNRRICTANGGLPPAVKRKLYYAGSSAAA